LRAERDAKGQRLLAEVELWEVSLVTFPMLAEARVSAKADGTDWQDMAAIFDEARDVIAGLRKARFKD